MPATGSAAGGHVILRVGKHVCCSPLPALAATVALPAAPEHRPLQKKAAKPMLCVPAMVLLNTSTTTSLTEASSRWPGNAAWVCVGLPANDVDPTNAFHLMLTLDFGQSAAVCRHQAPVQQARSPDGLACVTGC